jgi:site-specific DNA recombinase
MDLELFSAVQVSLDAKIGARAERLTRASKSPLAGLLDDSADNWMSPTSSRGKSGTLHRYYVSNPKLSGRPKAAGAVSRVPAGLSEDLIKDRLTRLFFADADWDWAKARQQIVRIIVAAEHIEIELSASAAESETDLGRRLPKVDRLSRDGALLRLVVSARLKAGKGGTLLLNANGRLAVGQKLPDQTLVRAIARAHVWRSRLASGAAVNIAAIAKEEGFTNGPVRHLPPLAYLSPDVTRAALAGRL